MQVDDQYHKRNLWAIRGLCLLLVMIGLALFGIEPKLEELHHEVRMDLRKADTANSMRRDLISSLTVVGFACIGSGILGLISFKKNNSLAAKRALAIALAVIWIPTVSLEARILPSLFFLKAIFDRTAPNQPDYPIRYKVYQNACMTAQILAMCCGFLILWRISKKKILPGACDHCGYDLTGNISGICSECGSQVAGSTK